MSLCLDPNHHIYAFVGVPLTEGRYAVIEDVLRERHSQDTKWGEQNHPDGTSRRFIPMAELAREVCDQSHQQGTGTWSGILNEEVWEAFSEEDEAKLRTELVQVAAVAVAWVEAIDRR